MTTRTDLAELDMMSQVTARLIELSEQRETGSDVRWRLGALAVQLGNEAERRQLELIERFLAKCERRKVA